MLTILLVDNDPDDYELLQAALEHIDKEGKVVYTEGCEDLLSIVIKHKPDIVFIDINMPGINGIECLRGIRVHQDFNALPIIMYSTSSNKVNIQQSFDNNANLYIIKPHSFQGIIEALQRVLKIDWKRQLKPTLSDFVIAS